MAESIGTAGRTVDTTASEELVVKGSKFEEIRYYEVFYPGEKTCDHPCNELKNGKKRIPRDCVEALRGSISVPVAYVSHGTHNEAASNIIVARQNQFSFIPKKKNGKDYTNVPNEHDRKFNGSYRFNAKTKMFKKIPPSEMVFPGHLIWWGISINEWYRGDGKAVGEAVERMWQQGVYTAAYLTNPPGCKYGTNVFTIRFCDLLECYRNSRGARNIVFRLGGTLRYKHEICYVYLVCTNLDEDDKSLQAYQKLQVDGVNFPNILIQYLVTFAPREGFCDWENYTFALYYPTDQSQLICPSDKMTRTEIDFMSTKQKAERPTAVHHESSCLDKVLCKKCTPCQCRCPDHKVHEQAAKSPGKKYKTHGASK